MTKTIIKLSVFALLFTSCGMGGSNNAEQQTDSHTEEICETATFDEGVVINGVRWATRNVDAPGTFAQSPEDAGGFFTWYDAQNACPRGWRVPTRRELQSLVDAGSQRATKNDVNGRRFGSGNNSLFLPMAGHRGSAGGRSEGWYWSSSSFVEGNGCFLWVSGRPNVSPNASSRIRFTVRCVAK